MLETCPVCGHSLTYENNDLLEHCSRCGLAYDNRHYVLHCGLKQQAEAFRAALTARVAALEAKREKLRKFCEDVERECAAIYAVMSDPEKRQDRKLQIYTGETAMRLGTRARVLLNAPAQGETEKGGE